MAHECPACHGECDCDRGLPGCEHLCLQFADDAAFSIAIRLPQRARQLLLRAVGLTDMALVTEVTDADVQQFMCGLLLAALDLQGIDQSLSNEIQALNEDMTRDVALTERFQ